jgi:hypothetical protein
MTEDELKKIEREVNRTNVPPCDGACDGANDWWFERYLDIQKLVAEVRRLSR